MNKIQSLGQVRSIGVSTPDHTAKVHNKFDTRISILEELRAFASSVPDFRRLNKVNIRHRLDDIIMLMILGRIAGHVGRADMNIMADKEKWGGNMTIIEYESSTVKKSTGACASEKRLSVSSLPTDTPMSGAIVRNHWSIESMYWGLDVNLLQDKIIRKSIRAVRNLDTIQRLVYSVFSIWKRFRKKRSDRNLGMAALIRRVSMSFTGLMRFSSQK
ncbi:hypothetical protein [Muribaculum intestinale]|uniref:hypothetical protein n=1 Tax=Muribaculum intestinale TaxID=1796646 RepID=UPI00260F087A|nr:hypothetical protein [Muribaculum intestinale]